MGLVRRTQVLDLVAEFPGDERSALSQKGPLPCPCVPSRPPMPGRASEAPPPPTPVRVSL